MNNNPVRHNDPSGHDVGCGGQYDGQNCKPIQTIKPKTPTQTLIGPPNPKRYFLGSFYIPPAEPPEVEDDGDANISNKAEWLANGLDFLAEHLPRGISPDKPDNVAVFASYEVSDSGVDNIAVFIDNSSDELVSLTSIKISHNLSNTNLTPLEYHIQPQGALDFALVQARPKTSSEFLLCSNCLSTTPNANVNFLPNRGALIMQVYIAWIRNGINVEHFTGNISP